MTVVIYASVSFGKIITCHIISFILNTFPQILIKEKFLRQFNIEIMYLLKNEYTVSSLVRQAKGWLKVKDRCVPEGVTYYNTRKSHFQRQCLHVSLSNYFTWYFSVLIYTYFLWLCCLWCRGACVLWLGLIETAQPQVLWEHLGGGHLWEWGVCRINAKTLQSRNTSAFDIRNMLTNIPQTNEQSPSKN